MRSFCKGRLLFAPAFFAQEFKYLKTQNEGIAMNGRFRKEYVQLTEGEAGKGV